MDWRSGNWSNPANWSTNPVVPNSGTIDNGGTAIINSGDNFAGGGATVGDGTGSGSVTMNGGTLGSREGKSLKGSVVGNNGSFTQNGGLNFPYTGYNSSGVWSQLFVGTTPPALGQGGSTKGHGSYMLGGGSLDTNAIYVGQGGTGTFTQTGGSIGAYGTNGANYAIGIEVGSGPGGSGGTRQFQPSGRPDCWRPETVGGYTSGAGTFTQSGGTNAIVGGGDSPQNVTLFSTKNFYSSYYAGLYSRLGRQEYAPRQRNVQSPAWRPVDGRRR